MKAALLVLEDGETFRGEALGAAGIAAGEVVFNTAMTGYQEILTDPSYAGQILAMTYPHIGNYGTTPRDDESRAVFCAGLVVRDLVRRHSNWRADRDLGAFLAAHGVTAIGGIDTRRLTRHLRDRGSLRGAFGADASGDDLLGAALACPGTAGEDLATGVSVAAQYEHGRDGARFHVVAYDLGLKRSILERLAGIGARTTVVPAGTSADVVRDLRPDGVFLSNGPGDPEPLAGPVAAVTSLLGEIPIFGICLGHQILGLALGGRTYKLPFGHHGANHPVRDETSGAVLITSQNHNYAVELPTGDRGVVATHTNLNDGTLEGLSAPGQRAFAVQFHPEASPGPHEAGALFARFAELLVGERV